MMKAKKLLSVALVLAATSALALIQGDQVDLSGGYGVYNVKTYGAVGNGVANDGPSIQSALTAAKNAGGGRVYLPPGTYLSNQTLLIGDKVELFGGGKRTSTIKRGDSADTVTFQTAPACSSGTTASSKMVIINDNYNCGNTGIQLHDFGIDSSALTIACTSCTAGPTAIEVGISLSAVTDLDIHDLYLASMPQDGIFVRNGGVHTSVHHVTINGHNLLWGNGSGVNVEMHTGTSSPGNNPGVPNISDNYIVSSGPDFCDLDLHLPCAADADCSVPGGVCGVGGGASVVSGISAIWASDTGGTVAAKALIARNRIESTDNHIGINTVGCQGCEITDNRIEALASATAMSKIFAGIVGTGASVTTVRALTDTLIARNLILGGGVANDRRGILVADDTVAGSARIKVLGNIVRNKSLKVANFLGAIEVRGVADSEVVGNTVQNITANHGIVIGAVGITTSDVQVVGNTVSDITAASADCVALKNVTRVKIDGNTFRNCSRGVEYQTATINGVSLGRNVMSSVTTPVLATAAGSTLRADVTDFGAAGNNSTNDSAAIQAAIDAVGAGGEIYFPKGTYVVTTALLFDTGQHFLGAAQGGSDSGGSLKGSIINTTTSGMTVFQARTKGTTRTDSPSFQHLAIRVTGANAVGIDLSHVNEAQIDHVAIAGTQAAGQVGVLISSNQPTTVSGGLGTRVTNSSFFLLARGIVLRRTANMNWIGPGNRIYVNTNYAVSVQGSCTSGATLDCETTADCAAGVCSSTGTTFSLNNHIINNWLEDNLVAHILDFGFEDEIADNYTEPQSGVTITAFDLSGSHTLVHGNFINAFANQIGLRLNAVTGAVIQGNIFHSTASTVTNIQEATTGTNIAVGLNDYNGNASAVKVSMAASSGIRWIDTMNSLLFAALSTNGLGDGTSSGANCKAGPGSMLYCSNCAQPASVPGACSTAGGTGTGAMARCINGLWNCN